MGYLERNELILKEIKNELKRGTFQRGEETGKSACTRFIPMGCYESPVVGETVHVGLKESSRFRNQSKRAEMDLAKIAVVAKYIPSLSFSLPLFHGSLAIGESRVVTITEDFSQGGTIYMEQWHYNWAKEPDLGTSYEMVRMGSGETDFLRLFALWSYMKEELTKLDPRLESEVYDLTSMCFAVGDTLRLGDFDQLFSGKFTEQILANFPLNCALTDFMKYVQRNQLHIRTDIPAVAS